MVSVIKTLLKQAYFSRTLNKLAVRLYSMRNPPPYLRPDMEFETDVWNGISSFHAHDGRQIGENNTHPQMYKETIATEHRTCKFEGSRFGLPMNVTALRNVMSAWDDTLQFVTLARGLHMAHRGHSGTHLNLRQAYVFSKIGAGYAAFLARRRHAPIADGELDALDAAFFTLGVGPFMVVRALMERGDLRALDEQPITGEGMYALADDSGSLVSGAGVACAGARRLIVEILDVAMNGSYAKPLTSPKAQRALARIDDWDAFHAYLYASSRLELLVKLHQALCSHALLGLLAHPHVMTDTEHSLVMQSLERTYHRAGSALDDRTVVRNFVRIALALLDELDGTAVRVALESADLVGHDSADFRLQAIGPEAARTQATRCVRRATELLFPMCRADLAGVHAALGRKIGRGLGFPELLRRSGGAALVTLLERLDAPRAEA